MQTAPQIVVTRIRDNGAWDIVSELPFGSWGLKTAMGLAYDLGEQIRSAGKDPSAFIQIAIGELDWPAHDAIDDMIMFDAVDYPTKLGMLEDLFERSRHFIARTDPLDHHVALLTLFEILEVGLIQPGYLEFHEHQSY